MSSHPIPTTKPLADKRPAAVNARIKGSAVEENTLKQIKQQTLGRLVDDSNKENVDPNDQPSQPPQASLEPSPPSPPPPPPPPRHLWDKPWWQLAGKENEIMEVFLKTICFGWIRSDDLYSVTAEEVVSMNRVAVYDRLSFDERQLVFEEGSFLDRAEHLEARHSNLKGDISRLKRMPKGRFGRPVDEHVIKITKKRREPELDRAERAEVQVIIDKAKLRKEFTEWHTVRGLVPARYLFMNDKRGWNALINAAQAAKDAKSKTQVTAERIAGKQQQGAPKRGSKRPREESVHEDPDEGVSGVEDDNVGASRPKKQTRKKSVETRELKRSINQAEIEDGQVSQEQRQAPKTRPAAGRNVGKNNQVEARRQGLKRSHPDFGDSDISEGESDIDWENEMPVQKRKKVSADAQGVKRSIEEVELAREENDSAPKAKKTKTTHEASKVESVSDAGEEQIHRERSSAPSPRFDRTTKATTAPVEEIIDEEPEQEATEPEVAKVVKQNAVPQTKGVFALVMEELNTAAVPEAAIKRSAGEKVEKDSVAAEQVAANMTTNGNVIPRRDDLLSDLSVPDFDDDDKNTGIRGERQVAPFVDNNGFFANPCTNYSSTSGHVQDAFWFPEESGTETVGSESTAAQPTDAKLGKVDNDFPNIE